MRARFLVQSRLSVGLPLEPNNAFGFENTTVYTVVSKCQVALLGDAKLKSQAKELHQKICFFKMVLKGTHSKEAWRMVYILFLFSADTDFFFLKNKWGV